ncbi:hypothetical protein ACU6QH_04385 [Aeromonas veronii]|uniref:hypothetical protein n=1 Tax=Aeromonas veronii TaxID=654 RepID=UPI00406C1D08
MHIEITGRQTGKTERLMAAANQFIAQGKRVVIVCCNSRLMMDYLQKGCPGAWVSGDKYLTKKTWFEELDNDHDAIWMFDEFDWFDNQSVIKIRPNGYYYTTPRPPFNLMKPTGDRPIAKLMQTYQTNVDTIIIMPCHTHLRDDSIPMDFWGIDCAD